MVSMISLQALSKTAFSISMVTFLDPLQQFQLMAIQASFETSYFRPFFYFVNKNVMGNA